MTNKYNYQFTNNDYLTPPEIIQFALGLSGEYEFFGKCATMFDVDVCCSIKNILAKKHFINGIQDGLKEEWVYSKILCV